jgi:hypothetical protein
LAAAFSFDKLKPFIASPLIILFPLESLIGFPCPKTPKLFPFNLTYNIPPDKLPIPNPFFKVS